MLESIKKTMRYLERQHKSKATGAGLAAGGAVAGGALLATGVIAGPLAPVVLMVPAWAGFMTFVAGSDPSRVRGNECSVNDFKLVGDPSDLSKISAMQEFIDKKTKKLQHLGRLPEKLEAQLQRHIADVAPVLQRVRVYKSYPWKDEDKGELSSFEFQRKFLDEKSATATQPLARVELVPMGLLQRSEPARLVVEQMQPQQALPAPEVLSGEFKALADKVEGVAERVVALEQPAPAVLEKPKFRGNNRS